MWKVIITTVYIDNLSSIPAGVPFTQCSHEDEAAAPLLQQLRVHSLQSAPQALVKKIAGIPFT